ncbi:hypothetical protein SESBI_50601 [Sesbania bispinosa]|nr:hypothetical protein SESBI_50601 [Sesbania bispinosa]
MCPRLRERARFDSDFKLRWNLNGVSDLASLKPMLEDEHAIELCSSAIEHKVVRHIYVEHLGGVGGEVQVGVGSGVGQDGVGSVVDVRVGSAVGQEVAADQGDDEDG